MGTQGFEPRPAGLEPATLPDYAMPPNSFCLHFYLYIKIGLSWTKRNWNRWYVGYLGGEVIMGFRQVYLRVGCVSTIGENSMTNSFGVWWRCWCLGLRGGVRD